MPPEELAAYLVECKQCLTSDEGMDGEMYDYYMDEYVIPHGEDSYMCFEDALQATVEWLNREYTR